MAWPRGSESWFNPWPIKYLMPAVKWFPLIWPNAEWEVSDGTYPMKLGTPPDGAIVPWWKLPKDQRPVEAPWGEKWLGAWPASQVTMSEDLTPSIWPGGHRAPPFGFIKLGMPGEPVAKHHQISFMNMRIQMRPDIGHVGHHLRIMSRNTKLGQKFYLIDRNWDKYEYDYKMLRAMFRHKRLKEIEAMIEKMEPIAPRPSVDLFDTGEKTIKPMRDLFS
jgi:hypothetical protein